MTKSAGKKSAVTSRATTSSKPRIGAGWRERWKWAVVAAAVLVLVGVVGIPVANKYWPYRYRNVKPMLENVMASQIKIDQYHRIYFPSPGFVASGVTLRRNTAQDLPPLGTVRNVIVRGSWIDLLLLRQRVQLVDLEGLHLELPAVGSRASQQDFPAGSSADFAGPTTAIMELRVRDSLMDILRTNGGRYSFPIQKLVLRDLQKGKAVKYVVDMQNAQPTGLIHAKGSFGPLNAQDLAATPLSDDFTFTQVRLGDIGGIGGTLAAKGRFSGTLGAIEAEASEETPDFAVAGGRPTKVTGDVQCVINGTNGELLLRDIKVNIGQTTVRVVGSIAGSPKVTKLDVAESGGRVQDLLQMFMKDAAPVRGPVSLHSHVELAPAQHGANFFERLRLEGSFDVPEERLTRKSTEQELSAFSERARGMKTEEDAAVDVMSSLAGDVRIRGGVLSTERLHFEVPGAAADLKGTFDLRSSAVHMTGDVKMQSELSNAATGWKSVLLKPLNPLFKKQHAGAVVPIAVVGGPGSYKVTQNVVPLN